MTYLQLKKEQEISIGVEKSIGMSLPSSVCWGKRVVIPIWTDSTIQNSQLTVFFDVSVRFSHSPSLIVNQLDSFEVSSKTPNLVFDVPMSKGAGGNDCYILIQSNSLRNNVGVWLSERDVIDTTSTYINGFLQKGDLSFYTYSSVKLGEMLTIIPRIIPEFWVCQKECVNEVS